MPGYKFQVGEIVHVSPSRNVPGGSYKVIKQLPEINHPPHCEPRTDVEDRVGQRILGDPRGEVNGLLVQMIAIQKLARAGLPREGRELLDLAVAKEEKAAIGAEGRKTH
jgi:hypothetical protein